MAPLKRFQSVSTRQRSTTADTVSRRERSVTVTGDDADTIAEARERTCMAQSRSRTSGGAASTTTQAEETEADAQTNEASENIPLSEKIVLCLTTFMGKIGCSYYDPQLQKLFLIEDSLDSPKFDLALNIVEQVRPHLLLVSNRSDEGFIDGIKTRLTDMAMDHAAIVEIRSNKEFSSSQGRLHLLNLPLLSVEGGDLQDPLSARNRNHGVVNAMNREADTHSDDVIDTAVQRNRDAYSFMQLRNRNRSLAKTAEQRVISNLKLGGSVLQNMNKSLETVACLLNYVSRRRNLQADEDEDEGDFHISSIELIALSKTMMVNADAMYSLQIFEDESHANVHTQKKGEGLSLFHLLSRTKTPLGRALMRRWMTQPSLEISVLDNRFDAVECFTRVDNQHISSSIVHALNIKNVPRVLKLLRTGLASHREWLALSDFLTAAIKIRESVSNLSGGKDVEILRTYFESFEVNAFSELRDDIEDKIDWPESRDQHRVCIREGVDGKLDDNRRIYQGLPNMLSRIAEHITLSLEPGFCTSLNVVYFPQLGYLCAIPLTDRANDDPAAPQTPPGWTQQFETEVSIYYKNTEMRDLDEWIGDLHGFILDREVEIIQEMLLRALKQEDVFREVSDILAEIDVLLSFADASKQYEWTRPLITESNVLRIDSGRHPLVEMVVENLQTYSVKNDAHLVGGQGITVQELERVSSKPSTRALLKAERAVEKARRAAAWQVENGMDAGMPSDDDEEDDGDLISPDDSILILTGANASGKSVFLKMVAIIVYMGHLGCFVPAEKAIIGLTDKILTRVSTRESVSKGASAFMIDLQQLSFMLRNCTQRSLLLIDEFGKGTNASDGAGLFIGLVKHLVTQGPKLPKTLLTTHFHEIFQENAVFLNRRLPIGLAHMELLADIKEGPEGGVSEASGMDTDPARVTDVIPLFKLAPGLCLKSYAFHCAESYGIAPEIVSRAMAVSKALSSFSMHEIMDPKMSEEDERTLRESEIIARKLLQTRWEDDDEQDEETGERKTTMKKLAECLGETYIEPRNTYRGRRY